MDEKLIGDALVEIKDLMEDAITTGTYAGKRHASGLEAKTALIRSGRLIQRLHEIVKLALRDELANVKLKGRFFPPIGATSPEQDIWGLLKKKKQDVVVLLGDSRIESNQIQDGPMAGEVDEFGVQATRNSIVVGVRSQLSSIAKNIDTLMERAFAETLNIRLRHPSVVMGEVYLLLTRGYDEQLMKRNRVGWVSRPTDIDAFVSIFNGMSHRKSTSDFHEAYKYERSALLLVDFSEDPPRLYRNADELLDDGLISNVDKYNYEALSHRDFARDLIKAYSPS